MNSKVDFYFTQAEKWREELNKLRTIVLECGLNEELKWGVPCYTFQQANIVLIHVFKEYFAYLFFKGSLLTDTAGILIQQSQNVQAARQVRFTGMSEIVEKETALKEYIFEAIEVEKAGMKVKFKKTAEFIVAEEFKDKLDEMPALKSAFEQLTPGRQRAYMLHFSAPKQSSTRTSRIEKCLQQILDGKGLND